MTTSAVAPAPCYCLRGDLIIVEQQQDGKPYFVVKDPTTGKIFGFNRPTFALLKSLDGMKTVEEVATALAATKPSELPAVRARIAAVVERARASGLLSGEDLPPTLPKDASSKFAGLLRKYNPFYLRFGISNPTPFFRRLGWIFFPLFTRTALLGLLVCLAGSFALIGYDLVRFWNSFLIFKFFSSWILVYVLLFLSTVLHETAHAMACLRYGGAVRELGFLLYLFRPGFYTDVSDAWLFPKPRDRIVVAIAGIYVELFIFCAGIATWFFTAKFSLPNQIGFLVAILVFSRIVVNLLPFLKLDGYFILSDLLQIRNLRSKSFAHLASLVPVVGARYRPARPPPMRERVIFCAYGMISLGFVVATLYEGATRGRIGLIEWSPRWGAIFFWILFSIILIPAVLSIREMLRQHQTLVTAGASAASVAKRKDERP